MTLQLPAGFRQYDADEYHADTVSAAPTLSRSTAHTMLERSPMHAWAEHPRLGNLTRREATDAMDFGTLVHKLALGKGTEYEIGEFPNWMTKAAKEWRDECRANGLIPILEKDAARAQEAVAALAEHLQRIGATWLLEGETELGMTWTEPEIAEGRVTCRGMMDVLNVRPHMATIVDLKTTGFGHPRALPSSCVKYGYDLQDAFYRRGVEVLMPDYAGRIEFVFVFVESHKPYTVTVCELNGMFQAIGRRKYDRAVEMWDRCIRSNNWPGYGDDIHEIEPPGWLLSQQMTTEEVEVEL